MFGNRASSPARLLDRYRLWRAIHILSAVFVCSYLSFHVLDLDLSDFPLTDPSGETTLAITEAPETTELFTAMSENRFRIMPSLLDPSIKESIRLQQKNLRRQTRVRDTRLRLRRLMIPCSSTAVVPSLPA
jgi:hypothetical protein